MLARQQQASQTRSSSSAESRGRKEGDSIVDKKDAEDKDPSSDEDETEDVSDRVVLPAEAIELLGAVGRSNLLVFSSMEREFGLFFVRQTT